MSEDRLPRSDRGHRKVMSILLLAIIGVSVILIAGVFWRFGVPGVALLTNAPDDRASLTLVAAKRITSYVGPATCRECHPGESALFARSGHGRTLWPAAADNNPVVAWLDGKTWKDPEVPEATWSYQVKEGRLVAGRGVERPD